MRRTARKSLWSAFASKLDVPLRFTLIRWEMTSKDDEISTLR
ncbi:hypothetical protein AB5I39_10085 [Sphingomonas sp. MMS24-J45]